MRVKQRTQLAWVTGRQDAPLAAGDQVRTQAAATAQITFLDGTLVEVRPDSLVTIDESVGDARGAGLESGRVNFRVPAGHAGARVRTPGFEWQAGAGASGAVIVDAATGSEVRVHQGSGVAQTKSGAVTVETRRALRVSPQGETTQAVLPERPDPLTPPVDTEIAYSGRSAPATLLSWKRVPDAAGYHVTVDYSDRFTRPIFDRKGVGRPELVVPSLPDGRYYWRVAAVGKDGTEGEPSETRHFTLARERGGR